jgi:PKD repeat protein
MRRGVWSWLAAARPLRGRSCAAGALEALPVSLPGRLDEAAGRSGLLGAWVPVLVALLLIVAGAQQGLCDAAFSASPTSGMAPLLVTFTNVSTTGWCFEWTFGDGGSSDSPFPYVQHTYTHAGVYTVSLLAMDLFYGCDTEVRTNYITVTAPPPPVASFSGHPTCGTAPLTVTFTDSSTNSPTSWSWTFGDGGASTSRNPSHVYTAVGTYTVALTATNAGGSNSITRTNYISALVPPVPPEPAFTERVSVARDGTEGNDDSQWAALSADGRYAAFDSSATDLVAEDTNGWALDVFVHDRLTGETELVSVASDGTQGNADSASPAISGDGRYVAFVSDATNLVSGDTNGYRDVFVHDRQTGQTTRVSLSSTGAQGNSWSGWPVSISADGRFVAFVAGASNLVSGDTNDLEDIFVRDRQTGQTERASVASDGSQANDLSYSPSITPEGRYVAFQSRASNLVAGDTNGYRDIFVRDRQAHLTERVSVASDGTQGNNACPGDAWPYRWPSISANGRYVAFFSWATNLVAGDTNGDPDVFVHDRQTGETTRVSVASDGTQGDLGSESPAISADGRYVAFQSDANNLVPGEPIYCTEVYVHDRQTGQTERVSVDNDGTPASGTSGYPIAVSADGRYVNFASVASNLVAGDTNDACDSFVRDRVQETGFYAWPSTRGKAPLLVGFADLSPYTPTGPATAWEWDFGDGGTSAEQNPTHEYADPGVYTVSLTATCAEGSLVTTKNGYITVSFRDVAIFPADGADYWALNYILACVEANIVGGYPDGTYRPTQPVDRGQMAVYIARGLVSPSGDAAIPSGPAVPTFSDVPSDHWAYKWIEYTVSQNVVQGYPDGTYRPDQVVDRGQMAVYVTRAVVAPSGDAGVPEGPPDPTFTDVPTGHPYYKWIEFAVDEGIVSGYPDHTYRPAVIVTRDQMAVYVQRAFELPL